MQGVTISGSHVDHIEEKSGGGGEKQECLSQCRFQFLIDYAGSKASP